jgi:hypothetical protein
LSQMKSATPSCAVHTEETLTATGAGQPTTQ